ncbi:aminotransferase, class V [Bacteriovorax sp. DB6_IX]|nr:aminotransferase, class V [Bacteriovorax sp. DB6_IX]
MNEFQLFFHSGATEAINNIVKGFCFKQMRQKKKFHVIAFSSDHPSSVNQADQVELLGGEFHLLNPMQSGDFDKSKLIEYIQGLDGEVLLNYTHVNSVNGVIWSLEDAADIKTQTGCLIHVDAVQMVGKIEGTYELETSLDYYTFSGHKFGALKGIGFTFVKDVNSSWESILVGGGQQDELRSGTENIHGIYSLKLALEEFKEKFNMELLKSARVDLEDALKKEFPTIELVSQDATRRNLNTLSLIIPKIKTDILITAFDMAKIEISSGSACSSGSIRPSQTLLAMGYSEEQAKSSIRISLPLFMSEGEGIEIFEKIKVILSRFLKS